MVHRLRCVFWLIAYNVHSLPFFRLVWFGFLAVAVAVCSALPSILWPILWYWTVLLSLLVDLRCPPLLFLLCCFALSLRDFLLGLRLHSVHSHPVFLLPGIDCLKLSLCVFERFWKAFYSIFCALWSMFFHSSIFVWKCSNCLVAKVCSTCLDGSDITFCFQHSVSSADTPVAAKYAAFFFSCLKNEFWSPLFVVCPFFAVLNLEYLLDHYQNLFVATTNVLLICSIAIKALFRHIQIRVRIWRIVIIIGTKTGIGRKRSSSFVLSFDDSIHDCFLLTFGTWPRSACCTCHADTSFIDARIVACTTVFSLYYVVHGCLRSLLLVPAQYIQVPCTYKCA